MIILIYKDKTPCKKHSGERGAILYTSREALSFELSSDVGSCALLEKGKKLKARAKPNPIQQYGQTSNCHRVSSQASILGFLCSYDGFWLVCGGTHEIFCQFYQFTKTCQVFLLKLLSQAFQNFCPCRKQSEMRSV